jgi:hypothetical protein
MLPIFDNPTAFDSGNGVLNHYARTRKGAIEHFIADAQFPAFRLFLGCMVSTPSGS